MSHAKEAQSNYTPQVGDRVTHRTRWAVGVYVTVTAVGRTQFLANDRNGDESRYYLEPAWVKVPEPVAYPERWINVYPDDIGHGQGNRHEADRDAVHDHRIAVIHLAADGTVTLHPVERES